MMMHGKILQAVMLACGLCSVQAVVSAYFPNWAQYHTAPYTYTPDKLAGIVGKLDILNYAFAYFDPNTFAVIHPEPKDPQFYAEVMQYKQQYPNLKVVLSIGGWNFPSAHFSNMVSSAANRNAFITSLKAYMSEYGFDGVDLDWEYPCSPPRQDPIKFTCDDFKTTDDAGGNCPADTANFLLLVQDLRKAFGTSKLITVASQAGAKNWEDFDLKSMSQYIDYYNLMTYDYTVSDIPNSNTTAPNSPLYTPSDPSVTQMSANYTVQGYLQAGVDPKKMLLGIAFYGHTWYVPNLQGNDWQKFGLEGQVQGECCGPFKSTFGAKFGKGCSLCGTMMFSEVQASGPEYYFDQETQTCIGYFQQKSGDGWTEAGTWITFADQNTVAAFTKYAKKMQLGGVFAFDVSEDSIDFSTGDPTYELLNKMADTWNGGGSGNICSPVTECNVCSGCCKSYLHSQQDCDACVADVCK